MNTLLLLALSAIYFTLSGTKNALYYIRNEWYEFIIIVMMVFNVGLIMYSINSYIGIPIILIMFIVLIMQENNFSTNNDKRIHWSEELVSWSYHGLVFYISRDILLNIAIAGVQVLVFNVPIFIACYKPTMREFLFKKQKSTVDYYLFGKRYFRPRPINTGIAQLSVAILSIIGYVIYTLIK